MKTFKRACNQSGNPEEKRILLAGNPNVGKSTVFNCLTGMHQHTGNWAGKTVGNAVGKYEFEDITYKLVDIPGTYSLMASSPEEEIARDAIFSDDHDLVVLVVDATSLERNLYFVIQVLQITHRVVVCVNLMDEAEKKNIYIDLNGLSKALGVPVVGTEARCGAGMEELRQQIGLSSFMENKNSGKKIKIDRITKEMFYENAEMNDESHDEVVLDMLNISKSIYEKVVRHGSSRAGTIDERIDKIVTSRALGVPIMLLLLCLIFWLTITGANYPSRILSEFFQWLGVLLSQGFSNIHAPAWLIAPLMDGVYLTLTWVISVMLPPMAIFFPLFTLLEDSGYLPRMAFNLDFLFRRAQSHGKQALTTCMGFGCNACAVTGCRIIDSPREKLIAMLTNVFIPCNGRFPTLITIISIFFVTGGILLGGASKTIQSIAATVLLTFTILIGFGVSLIMSYILSRTVLKGIPSTVTLELPPYRRPQIGSVILRSILDRTVFVLGRAIVVAAPAGLIIWFLANIKVGPESLSLLYYCTNALDPLGQWMGMDGVILMAFVLGFPANEIVLPIIIMTYLSTGTLTELNNTEQLFYLLRDNGWTAVTAICVMLFCLMHFPCGTTCLTIKMESGSVKWTVLGFLLPTVAGILVCMAVNGMATLLF